MSDTDGDEEPGLLAKATAALPRPSLRNAGRLASIGAFGGGVAAMGGSPLLVAGAAMAGFEVGDGYASKLHGPRDAGRDDWPIMVGKATLAGAGAVAGAAAGAPGVGALAGWSAGVAAVEIPRRRKRIAERTETPDRETDGRSVDQAERDAGESRSEDRSPEAGGQTADAPVVTAGDEVGAESLSGHDSVVVETESQQIAVERPDGATDEEFAESVAETSAVVGGTVDWLDSRLEAAEDGDGESTDLDQDHEVEGAER